MNEDSNNFSCNYVVDWYKQDLRQVGRYRDSFTDAEHGIDEN